MSALLFPCHPLAISILSFLLVFLRQEEMPPFAFLMPPFLTFPALLMLLGILLRKSQDKQPDVLSFDTGRVPGRALKLYA